VASKELVERNIESKAQSTSTTTCINPGQQANQMLTNLEIKVVFIIEVEDSIKQDLKLTEYHLHRIIKKAFYFVLPRLNIP
jgi:hypothetical protein